MVTSPLGEHPHVALIGVSSPGNQQACYKKQFFHP